MVDWTGKSYQDVLKQTGVSEAEAQQWLKTADQGTLNDASKALGITNINEWAAGKSRPANYSADKMPSASSQSGRFVDDRGEDTGYSQNDKGQIEYQAPTFNVSTSYQAPSFTPPPTSYQKPNVEPVKPEAMVKNQMAGLLASDSPYLQQAREEGIRYANKRGLLNHSLAGGAAVDAAIRRALPIAQTDAGYYQSRGLANQQGQIQGALNTQNYGVSSNLQSQQGQIQGALNTQNYGISSNLQSQQGQIQGALNRQDYGMQSALNQQSHGYNLEEIAAQTDSAAFLSAQEARQKGQLSEQEYQQTLGQLKVAGEIDQQLQVLKGKQANEQIGTAAYYDNEALIKKLESDLEIAKFNAAETLKQIELTGEYGLDQAEISGKYGLERAQISAQASQASAAASMANAAASRDAQIRIKQLDLSGRAAESYATFYTNAQTNYQNRIDEYDAKDVPKEVKDKWKQDARDDFDELIGVIDETYEVEMSWE